MNDYSKEYPIIQETWKLINELRQELPELKKEAERVYSQWPYYLVAAKALEMLDEVKHDAEVSRIISEYLEKRS